MMSGVLAYQSNAEHRLASFASLCRQLQSSVGQTLPLTRSDSMRVFMTF